MRDNERERGICQYCDKPIVRESDGGDDRPEYVHQHSRAPQCSGKSIFDAPWAWPEPGTEVIP